MSFISETQGQPADYALDCRHETDSNVHRQQNSQQRCRFTTLEQFASETGFHAEGTRYVRLMCLGDLEQVMKMNCGHQRDQHLLIDLRRILQVDIDLHVQPLEVVQRLLFTRRLPQTSHPDTCIEMM